MYSWSTFSKARDHASISENLCAYIMVHHMDPVELLACVIVLAVGSAVIIVVFLACGALVLATTGVVFTVGIPVAIFIGGSYRMITWTIHCSRLVVKHGVSTATRWTDFLTLGSLVFVLAAISLIHVSWAQRKGLAHK